MVPSLKGEPARNLCMHTSVPRQTNWFKPPTRVFCHVSGGKVPAPSLQLASYYDVGRVSPPFAPRPQANKSSPPYVLNVLCRSVPLHSLQAQTKERRYSETH